MTIGTGKPLLRSDLCLGNQAEKTFGLANGPLCTWGVLLRLSYCVRATTPELFLVHYSFVLAVSP
jgi:hypothetical protein